MNIAFCGIHYFLPMLNELSRCHSISSITTIQSSKSAFVDLAANAGCPLLSADDLRGDYRTVESDVDVYLIAGFPYRVMLPDDARGMNFHPTMLPFGRGPTPISEVLIRHREHAGITVHKLTHAFDRGDILAQQRIVLDDNDDFLSYMFKIGLASIGLALDLLGDDLDRLDGVPQEEGSYWPKFARSDLHIRSEDSVELCRRKFLAFGNRTFFEIDGQRRHLHALSGWTDPSAEQPGKLMFDHLDITVMNVADGFVVLRWCVDQ